MGKRAKSVRSTRKKLATLVPTVEDALEVIASGSGEIVCGAGAYTARLRACGKLEGATCWELQIFPGLHPAADLDVMSPVTTIDITDDDLLRSLRTPTEIYQWVFAKALNLIPDEPGKD